MFFTLNYYIISDVKPDYNILSFVFFSTLFTYTFQRFVKIKFEINITGDRVDWMFQNKKVVIVILIISSLASLYFSFFFWEKVWKLVLISGLLSFFYVWKVPGLKGKNLRDLPNLKIYLIAIVWVIITVAVPYLVNGEQETNNYIILFVAEVLFMVSITIPFDIRDINLDETSKKTIPQLLGVKKSIYLSIILFTLSQLLFQMLLSELNFGILILTIIAIPILYKSNPKRKELYFSGVIDGILIIQPILLYLFNF